jgi:hypothetical protein
LLLILWSLSGLIRCDLFFVRNMSLLDNLPILLLFVRSSFFDRVTLSLVTSLLSFLLFGVSLTLLTLNCLLPLASSAEIRRLHLSFIRLNILTRLRYEFEPLRAQLLARRIYVSLMDALAEVCNEETSLVMLAFWSLLLSWLLTLRLVALCLLVLLLLCH